MCVCERESVNGAELLERCAGVQCRHTKRPFLQRSFTNPSTQETHAACFVQGWRHSRACISPSPPSPLTHTPATADCPPSRRQSARPGCSARRSCLRRGGSVQYEAVQCGRPWQRGREDAQRPLMSGWHVPSEKVPALGRTACVQRRPPLLARPPSQRTLLRQALTVAAVLARLGQEYGWRHLRGWAGAGGHTGQQEWNGCNAARDRHDAGKANHTKCARQRLLRATRIIRQAVCPPSQSPQWR